MKAPKNPITFWTGILVLGLTLGLGIQFVTAWQSPSLPAPNGNVPGPITTRAGQIKDGNLVLNTGQNGVPAQSIGLQVVQGSIAIGPPLVATAVTKPEGTGPATPTGLINARDVWLRDANGGVGLWASELGSQLSIGEITSRVFETILPVVTQEIRMPGTPPEGYSNKAWNLDEDVYGTWTSAGSCGNFKIWNNVKNLETCLSKDYNAQYTCKPVEDNKTCTDIWGYVNDVNNIDCFTRQVKCSRAEILQKGASNITLSKTTCTSNGTYNSENANLAQWDSGCMTPALNVCGYLGRDYTSGGQFAVTATGYGATFPPGSAGAVRTHTFTFGVPQSHGGPYVSASRKHSYKYIYDGLCSLSLHMWYDGTVTYKNISSTIRADQVILQ